jgi:hypothetical protein
MAFTGINMSQVPYGGLGKHAYDCTYDEIRNAYLVSNPSCDTVLYVRCLFIFFLLKKNLLNYCWNNLDDLHSYHAIHRRCSSNLAIDPPIF